MIAEFLARHLEAPFPSDAHDIELPGTDLVALDEDVVGLAQAYVSCGALTPDQQRTVRGRVEDLQRVVPELPANVRDYFMRLHALGVAVLQGLPVRGPAA